MNIAIDAARGNELIIMPIKIIIICMKRDLVSSVFCSDSNDVDLLLFIHSESSSEQKRAVCI